MFSLLLIVVDTVIKLPWTIFLKSATEAVWIASYRRDDNEFYPQLAGFQGAGHSENLGRRPFREFRAQAIQRI
ncbi:hypothetical protein AA650_05145 [Anabaena sp. WA102]|jgi:hypothetical protein|nr:hypothetical protein AA650_05145 [Anabaena sp. WA102]